MAIAVLLCARCGSHLVDVKSWRSQTVAILRCWACEHEAPIEGFTVGRAYQGDEASLVEEAKKDAAQSRQWWLR